MSILRPLSDHSPDPTPRPLDQLAACGDAHATALILKDRQLTYGELDEVVGKMAGWLSERFSPGDRIASWAAKGALTAILPLAAARAGVVHVPINPMLKHLQVGHILADSGARLLIANQGRLDSLAEDTAPAGCVVMEETSAYAAMTGHRTHLPPSDHAPDALAAILYTSGSTGKPKGVMLSHANMWLGAVSVAHYLRLGQYDVTLAVLPFAFDYGQNQLFSTWFAGGCVVPLDFLFPRDVVKACARHKVTTLAGVPPLWVQLADLDWPVDVQDDLRRITNSGGALTENLVAKLRTALPKTSIFAMYGLTEAFRSTYLPPDQLSAKPTSMGQAIPFAEILVVNDDGHIADDEEEGELVHCGPLVAQGYWRDAERTAERFRPAPAASRYGGTAVWSGDRVRRAVDGNLYFVGRHDAMIKSAGMRISPQEIETAALASGLVSEAVALGAPDPLLGQSIHLFVYGDGDERDLARYLSRELPTFMQPHHIHYRERLPVNPNGKLDRTALQKEIME